jgi:L-rhamnose isomerase
MRWDSDHVVILSDDLLAIIQEVVRGGYLPRVHIGLDYFDASINRVAAWTIGARNTLRAVLNALLEPLDALRTLEAEGNFSQRLALQEELKSMPSNAVWDYYCMQKGVPVGVAYMDVIKEYEKKVLSKRA